jgi:hypothetical protein
VNTTLTIDIGVIVAALAPTIAILATAWVAWKNANRHAAASQHQLDDIHVLVNDQMTHEKQARLEVLRAHRVVLKRLLAAQDDPPSPDEAEVLAALTIQIETLENEIGRRNMAAARIEAHRPAQH